MATKPKLTRKATTPKTHAIDTLIPDSKVTPKTTVAPTKTSLAGKKPCNRVLIPIISGTLAATILFIVGLLIYRNFGYIKVLFNVSHNQNYQSTPQTSESTLSVFELISQSTQTSSLVDKKAKEASQSSGTVPASLNRSINPKPEVAPKFCMNAPVLMYHHIQPIEKAKENNQESLTVDSKTFEDHISYLQKHGYSFIAADELVKSVASMKKLPGNPVVITLDDGYEDNYTYAFKTAKKYKAVINIMLPTNLMGSKGYLSWDQIKEMKKSKYVNFYNHTANHNAVTEIPIPEAISNINNAQGVLDSKLGSTPKIFSYPFGWYSDELMEALQKDGYVGAYGTETGSMQCDNNLFHLRRLRARNSPISDLGF